MKNSGKSLPTHVRTRARARTLLHFRFLSRDKSVSDNVNATRHNGVYRLNKATLHEYILTCHAYIIETGI